MKLPVAVNSFNWYLLAKFSLLQKAFMISAVFLLYCSALQTSLALVQGFSSMVTMHNSTALKENGMTKDILIFNSF